MGSRFGRFARLSLGIICTSVVACTVQASEWSLWFPAADSSKEFAPVDARSVRQAADGSYLVAGSAWPPLGSLLTTGAWVAKLGADGGILWQKTFGSAQWEEANTAQTTTDGGYVVAGDADPVSSASIWVMRLTSGGDVMWRRKYGAVTPLHAQSIAVTADGSFAIAGYAITTNFARHDALVLRLSPDGDLLWQKTYEGVSSFNSIQPTDDGGFVVAGTSPVSCCSAVSLLKLDANGNIAWHKVYRPDETGVTYADAQSVRTIADSGFIVVGRARVGYSNDDAWILRLDVSGNIVWQKLYGGPADDIANSAQPITDGYVIAGRKDYVCDVDPRESFCTAVHSVAWIFKLDQRGEILWQKTYALSNYTSASSAQATADGGYVAAGGTGWSNYEHAWILKLDANGEIGGCAHLGVSDANSPDSNAIARNGTAVTATATMSPIDNTFVVREALPNPQQQCNEPPLRSRLALEYYHPDYNHYFVTDSTTEIALLDAGEFGSWRRTGGYFRVFELGFAQANVCRFWSDQTFAPKSSHFYTPFNWECDMVKGNPDWRLEGEVFSITLTPDGNCGSGTVPLYRLYNNGMGDAPNHRYTTSDAVRSQMMLQGWISEGVGVGVIGCVPDH